MAGTDARTGEIGALVEKGAEKKGRRTSTGAGRKTKTRGKYPSMPGVNEKNRVIWLKMLYRFVSVRGGKTVLVFG